MPTSAQENAKKELLMRLGRKLHEGLADEKISLDPTSGGKDFQTELERVSTLIDYVKHKQMELTAATKEKGKSSRNKSL